MADAAAASGAQGTPRFKEGGFQPVKICTYFLDGRCQKGQACTFAHGLEELHPRAADLAAINALIDHLAGEEAAEAAVVRNAGAGLGAGLGENGRPEGPGGPAREAYVCR